MRKYLLLHQVYQTVSYYCLTYEVKRIYAYFIPVANFHQNKYLISRCSCINLNNSSYLTLQSFVNLGAIMYVSTKSCIDRKQVKKNIYLHSSQIRSCTLFNEILLTFHIHHVFRSSLIEVADVLILNLKTNKLHKACISDKDRHILDINSLSGSDDQILREGARKESIDTK